MNRKTKKFSKITSVMLLIFMLASVFTFTANAADDTVRIEVESIVDDINGKIVTLSFDNNTGEKLRIGWVGSPIEISTTQGEYSSDFGPDYMIPRGESEKIVYFVGCQGDVERIWIPEINLLDSRGLPDSKLEDVVVYDADEDIDFFEDDFSSINLFFVIPIAIFAIMFVGVIITIIVIHKKKNKLIAQFNPNMNNAPTTYKPISDREINPVNQNDGFSPPPSL